MATADALAEHRRYLVQAHQEMQRDYDKVSTTLAAGGVTLTLLVMDRFGADPRLAVLATLAWALFGLSLFATLASFETSKWAIVEMIDQIDEKKSEPTPAQEKWGRWTDHLNKFAGGLLIGGAVLLGWFASVNV